MARELGRSYVGTEHLVLGLLAGEADVAASALVHLGVTRAGVLATRCMKVDAPGVVAVPGALALELLKQSDVARS